MTDQRPDLQVALSGLKDFQRRTVDTAFDRLWGKDASIKFLVADEVGMGKTLVAKGVVARTIDHLWDREDRIDIVYICSNGQIARQNLRRLHEGMHAQIPHADRLTMLPTALNQMGEEKVNIISFTPGTSFHLGNSGGQARERALLFVMLQELWGRAALRSPKWIRFFRCRAGEDTMRRLIREVDRSSISAELLAAFGEALTYHTVDGMPIAEALRETADRFGYLRAGRSVSWPVSHRRNRLIGQLRQVLARTCITHLDPDLVILDEFQRFSQLLTEDDDASRLVQDLVGLAETERPGHERRTRTLLLSATPFKMYTLPDEPEGDDHYRDFTRTVTILAGQERAQVVQANLSQMRAALLRGDHADARASKDVAERELRRVMARTERLTVSDNGEGMVSEHRHLVPVTTADVRDYIGQAAVSRALDSPDGMEFWRSSPYVFELMERYQVKKRLEDELENGSGALRGLLQSKITPEDLNTFGEIDLGNPRLRWLADDVLNTGAWRAAWLAPSLPYYSPGGVYAEERFQAFTKCLVFSSWTVAPKGIATILSYEVERRLAQRSATMRNRGYFATRRRGLLTFTVADRRPSGMPALALLYPCTSLAKAGDPLRIAADKGLPLPMSRAELLTVVRNRIELLLGDLPTGHGEGADDQRWYWAAPFLLDREAGHTVRRLPFGGDDDGSDDTSTGLDQHRQEALGIEADELGPRPDDLAEVLAVMAIAAPGVCALRAVARAVGGAENGEDDDVRATASDWAWALRHLFNSPEIMAALEGEGDEFYWRQVLHHALNGNLQSVLDEYSQVLMAAHSLGRETRQEQLKQLAERFAEGSGLLASTQAMDFFPDGVTPADRRRIRTHFAVRYGRAAAIDDKTVQRETHVREAFNSPFWPFVLASTSVGQEGLDFHHYSHAVVHWNLPSNPVDLEQREGRVNRFRGHAVRKNIAQVHGENSTMFGDANPWPILFRLGAADRGDRSEIFPDWVYPLEGGAMVERHAPVLPMSRGTQHYRRLIRTLGAYRLTLGQPRQSDLIAYVGDQADLALDLSPRVPNPSPTDRGGSIKEELDV